MKYLMFIQCMLLLSAGLRSQSHTLTVINGFGSGLYEAGDTVHIWSEAYHGRDYFDTWSGDLTALADPLNWHTTVVMPDHSVTVEAIINSLSDEVVFGTAVIQGADTLKDVWFAFPGLDVQRGLVWMFHGTNGSGKNFFVSNNMLTCTKKLLSEGYAVISLDCEEKTYDEDFNMDGVYRWDYTFDSLQNIDVRNINAIRDTLIARGWIDAGTPEIAYGYSAGGAFATHIATQQQWYAGITHNSAGVPWVPSFGLTPILFSMTANDDHPEVGQAGNEAAESFSMQLLDRKICSEFHLTQPQPLYPQRFARDSAIDVALSTAIFNELKDNDAIDENNYLLYSSGQIIAVIAANPGDWPVILSLTPAQQQAVSDEVDETFATHRFNSDLFGNDLRFVMSLCDHSTSISHLKPYQTLEISPSIASDMIRIPGDGQSYIIFDTGGRPIANGKEEWINVNTFPAGWYIAVCGNKTGKFLKI